MFCYFSRDLLRIHEQYAFLLGNECITDDDRIIGNVRTPDIEGPGHFVQCGENGAVGSCLV